MMLALRFENKLNILNYSPNSSGQVTFRYFKINIYLFNIIFPSLFLNRILLVVYEWLRTDFSMKLLLPQFIKMILNPVFHFVLDHTWAYRQEKICNKISTISLSILMSKWPKNDDHEWWLLMIWKSFLEQYLQAAKRKIIFDIWKTMCKTVSLIYNILHRINQTSNIHKNCCILMPVIVSIFCFI